MPRVHHTHSVDPSHAHWPDPRVLLTRSKVGATFSLISIEFNSWPPFSFYNHCHQLPHYENETASVIIGSSIPTLKEWIKMRTPESWSLERKAVFGATAPKNTSVAKRTAMNCIGQGSKYVLVTKRWKASGITERLIEVDWKQFDRKNFHGDFVTPRKWDLWNWTRLSRYVVFHFSFPGNIFPPMCQAAHLSLFAKFGSRWNRIWSSGLRFSQSCRCFKQQKLVGNGHESSKQNLCCWVAGEVGFLSCIVPVLKIFLSASSKPEIVLRMDSMDAMKGAESIRKPNGHFGAVVNLKDTRRAAQCTLDIPFLGKLLTNLILPKTRKSWDACAILTPCGTKTGLCRTAFLKIM